jgi:RNA polymerase sigma-70 factor, ECF subfamily
MKVNCPPPLPRRSPFIEISIAPAVMPMSTASHPPDQSTAEACAQCARERDCKACFEELVRRFEMPLLHFLTRRLGSRHDAEDLLQETFLVAYRNLHRYRSPWRFSTWLFTIANRLAVSSRRRRCLPTLGDGGLIEPACANDPRAAAQGNEMRGKLWDAARQILEPDAFTAVWLSYVESMSAVDIGQVLGRNANAVRILLHRARARLAEQLGPAWKLRGVAL